MLNTQLHKNFLPRIGIDAHLSLVYRYAPKSMQCPGSLHVEDKQFIEKIKLFLMHAGTESQIGISIKMIMESLHLLIGTNHHLFSLPYPKYSFLGTTSWVQHLWEMAYKYKVIVKGPYIHTKPARYNDYALMDKLIEMGTFSTIDIQKINCCRIYLQVQNLSDISNGEGTHISTNILSHIKDPERVSKYTWPHQPRPPKSMWNIWDEAIQTVWSQSETNQLIPPLGVWISAPHQVTPWIYNQNNNTLYHKTSSVSYTIYVPTISSITRHRTRFSPDNSTCRIPKHRSYSAIVNRGNPKSVFIESIIKYSNNKNTSTVSDQHTKRFLNQVKCPHNSHLLANQILDGTAVAVTGASVCKHSHIGPSSYIICTNDLQSVVLGDHGVPPGSSPMDSYRAEIYGIYAILFTLTELCIRHNIKSGSIIIACDNKAGLQNSLVYDTKANTNQSSFDILWAIHALKCKLPIQIRPQHVKGHRDRVTSDLTFLEQLNCLVDFRAKRYRHFIEQSILYEYSDIHLLSQWSCKIENVVITGNIENKIKEWIYKQEMKKYLIDHK